MFDVMQQHQLQELHFFQRGQLNAIVAIHSTQLGPALGGCRIVKYQDFQQAVVDAARLARGMSYKSAVAQVACGGGKAVIIEPDGSYDRAELFHQFGRCVESLKGRYITAMDAGSSIADMDVIHTETDYVASHNGIGDPSPFTAEGVYQAIKASLNFHLGKSIAESVIAIQGLGNVGYRLLSRLVAEGATVMVADISQEKTLQAMKEFGVFVAPVNDILFEPCDVLAPCGLGGVLTESNIPLLNCKIVAGCANNQLENEVAGQMLHERKILFAPDYVINSGGLIFAHSRFNGKSEEFISSRVDSLSATLLDIFLRAREEFKGPELVAREIALERLGQ